MKATATDTTLDCGCVVTQYEVEDNERNVCVAVKHTSVSQECTAHKQRYGLASAWTRRAVQPEKPARKAAVTAPPQAVPA